MTLLLWLVACNGCGPKFPETPDDPPPVDTSQPPDTGRESAVDSGPLLPPRCDLLELEPNDVIGQAWTIPMEEWVCGEMTDTEANSAVPGDVDFMSFTTTQPGWVEVEVESAVRGASADMQFILLDPWGGSVTVFDGYLTTDPILRYPAEQAGTYTITLSETSYLAGDAYDWYLMASRIKAPIAWDVDEVEPNDSSAAAMSLTVGQRLFGRFDRTNDFDWYHVVTPADATTIRFTVEAFALGSPVDPQIALYEADASTLIRLDSNGEVDYDLDPWFEQKQTGPQEWYFSVRNEAASGGDYHWYTVLLEALYEEE